MSIVHAIVLGIVQGLSEFLPISSSGHLTLVPWMLGWDDFAGRPELKKSFDVALHLGTLVGAVAYLRVDVRRYAAAGWRMVARRPSPDGRIAWLLVLSAAPAGAVGVALGGPIERLDAHIWLIAVALAVFGALLLVADRRAGHRHEEHFGARHALVMGIAQAFALQPGASRSGVTITAARWSGFDRNAAARLSFLMSLPVIAGAGAWRLGSLVTEGGIPADMRAGFVAGGASSALAGWVAVWATLRLVRTRSFAPFVCYRVALAMVVVVLLTGSLR